MGTAFYRAAARFDDDARLSSTRIAGDEGSWGSLRRRSTAFPATRASQRPRGLFEAKTAGKARQRPEEKLQDSRFKMSTAFGSRSRMDTDAIVLDSEAWLGGASIVHW